MTTTHPSTRPRPAALPRDTALRLAGTEYQRVVDLFRGLGEADWSAATDCPGWDVRAIAAHLLGMVEMAASVREQARQSRGARKRGGDYLDALTGLQVDERAAMTPAELVEQYAARWPKALRGRTRVPGIIRRRRLPEPQVVGGRKEDWTIGYLVDVILTRDPWMHRVDVSRATGAELVLTPEHDGVLVADVVAEWAARHGRPYRLTLSGPAGGSWSAGTGGPHIDLDAVEFCRVLSGRGTGDGLLTTLVPF